METVKERLHDVKENVEEFLHVSIEKPERTHEHDHRAHPKDTGIHVETLKEGAEKLKHKATEGFENLKENIVDAKDKAGEGLQNVKETVLGAKDKVEDAIFGARETAGKGFERAKEHTHEHLHRTREGLEDFGENIADKVRSLPPCLVLFVVVELLIRFPVRLSRAH